MDRSTWPSPLTGQTILVAEDEAFISFDIETMLNEAGANVMAAKDQRGGLLAAKCAELTAAVLDIKLGSDSVDPICGCLEQRSVPFLFLTGDSGRDVQKWAPAPIFSKPFDGSLLINGVLGLLITGGPLINQPPDSIALAEHLIFQAQMRVARQQGLIGGLTERGQDSGSAHELLRIMLKNVILMQTYRQAMQGPS
jgi:DNA-binding response OmpR family regulator